MWTSTTSFPTRTRKKSTPALKCGVADGLKQINALLKKVPSAIDTAAEGAKGFFEELGL